MFCVRVACWLYLNKYEVPTQMHMNSISIRFDGRKPFAFVCVIIPEPVLVGFNLNCVENV